MLSQKHLCTNNISKLIRNCNAFYFWIDFNTTFTPAGMNERRLIMPTATTKTRQLPQQKRANCHNDIPEATIIGTASNEAELWKLMRSEVPDLVLLDLGLGGSTTAGVDICRQLRDRYPSLKILIFTGEILNERLWVEALSAGANGIILKTGNLLERDDVRLVMHGRNLVFNEPILEKIMIRFRKSVMSEVNANDALIDYDIDEYDERYLRHLALGYTKDMIANLRTMPFGAKSLEKRP